MESTSENFVSLFLDRYTLFSLAMLAACNPRSSALSPRPSTGLLIFYVISNFFFAIIFSYTTIAEGVEELLSLGDSESGIPRLLDVGSLLEAKCVDELSIVMYLAVLHHRTLNKVCIGNGRCCDFQSFSWLLCLSILFMN
jgi:hypothetical protein